MFTEKEIWFKRKITITYAYLTNKTPQNKINPFISITNSLPLLSNSTTFSQPEYLETNNQTKLYCMHLEDTRTSAIILSLSLSSRGGPETRGRALNERRRFHRIVLISPPPSFSPLPRGRDSNGRGRNAEDVTDHRDWKTVLYSWPGFVCLSRILMRPCHYGSLSLTKIRGSFH